MNEFSDLDSIVSNKISQTVLTTYSPNFSNMSLVNSRIYSPLPEMVTKPFSIIPKKLKYFTTSPASPTKLRLNSNIFLLPGIAADFKELISPFSLRTCDYSKLYLNASPAHLDFITQPGLKPKQVLQKPPRRLKALKTAEMVGSKKQLTVRKLKKMHKVN